MTGVSTEAKAIRTERLSQRYGDTLALDALDLTVEPGEVTGRLLSRAGYLS
jgi:ABC-type multidrug transport system ATPase subunit